MKNHRKHLVKKSLDKDLKFKSIHWVPDCFHYEFNLSNKKEVKKILSRIKMAEIIKNGFSSNEQVSAHLYAFDGVPFLLHENNVDNFGCQTFCVDSKVFQTVASEFSK